MGMSEFETSIIKIAEMISGGNNEKIKALEDRISKLENILISENDEVSSEISAEVGNAIDIADGVRQQSMKKRESKSFSEMQKASKDLLKTVKDVDQRGATEYSGYKDRDGRKIFVGDELDYSADGMQDKERRTGSLRIEAGVLKIGEYLVKGIGHGAEKHGHVFMDDTLLIKKHNRK